VVYLRQQNLYDAAWQFQYAAKLMPHNPEPRNNLGLVFERVGRLDEAVDWYAQAVDLSKDNPQLLGNLIRARLRRGDRDRQTLELLDRLVLAETRPDWRAWAQEQRALLSHVEDREPTAPALAPGQ
jgi:Flp pilus assembly protein TadD